MQQAGIRRPGLFDAGQAALTGDFSDALMRHEQRRVLQAGTRRWRHPAEQVVQRFAAGHHDAIERAPRWRDVADELPKEAQEVLFVRCGKTVHGAWIGGIFWHSNQKMAAAYWMPLPLPPNA